MRKAGTLSSQNCSQWKLAETAVLKSTAWWTDRWIESLERWVSPWPLIRHDVFHWCAFDTCQVLAIVRHGGKHLASNLCYLDTFQMCTRHADNLRYVASCFQTLYYVHNILLHKLSQVLLYMVFSCYCVIWHSIATIVAAVYSLFVCCCCVISYSFVTFKAAYKFILSMPAAQLTVSSLLILLMYMLWSVFLLSILIFFCFYFLSCVT